MALSVAAADSEAGLKAAAEAVLSDPATQWEECGTWVSDGPAVLMDSGEAGAELDVEPPGGGGLPARAPVPLPAGRWRVRAVHTEADEENWLGLVQLLPAELCHNSVTGAADGAE
ncbi:Imm21 family immunity protein [Streptomyces erythrochromogenes]|uniref:Imm21 family immunity protein n=1 Tax=Streptomyces erythrochromogenes TaxID=285574 RepID=UPI003632DFC6